METSVQKLQFIVTSISKLEYFKTFCNICKNKQDQSVFATSFRSSLASIHTDLCTFLTRNARKILKSVMDLCNCTEQYMCSENLPKCKETEDVNIGGARVANMSTCSGSTT